jgi:hypothetical protein
MRPTTLGAYHTAAGWGFGVKAACLIPAIVFGARPLVGDPTLTHVHFDISWDEVAKYVLATPRSLDSTAALINRFSDRFLLGTDEVARADQESYTKVYVMYGPLWAKLTPDARLKVRKENFERLFDKARRDVRAWEKADLERAKPASALGGVVFDR